MNLLIVIVNYRTADLTVDCLRSLADEVNSLGGVRVVVTDNQSGDDSPTKIQQAIDENRWSNWASLMPLARNGGFAYGNNEAIRPALASDNPPDFVLLLNPDTVIRPSAVKELIGFMQQNPEAGIAGSRLEDPDGTPQRSAFRFHSIRSELDDGLRLGFISKLLRNQCVAPPVRDDTHQTDWVAGASMIVRRKVFDAIGLMDEGYFMYYEEVDFCLRANRAGWPCWYVPASRVVHLVGQASGVTVQKTRPKRRPSYWFDSRRRYFLKNHGWFYTTLADAVWALSFATFRVRQLIQRKPDTDPPKLLYDFLRHSTVLKGAKV
ncbi:MAG: glycosyltransferase family 2 protein [Phycisphaerales bacterium]